VGKRGYGQHTSACYTWKQPQLAFTDHGVQYCWSVITMDLSAAIKVVVRQADPSSPSTPLPDEEYYSSWSLFLVCLLLIFSLWTSYYLQIKRIRMVHETLIAIAAGMFVGLIVRLSPGEIIKDMLVS
jgi:hypothetical protein